MIEILKVLVLFMIAIPISIVLGILTVGIPACIWILIEELFYYVKEKIYD